MIKFLKMIHNKKNDEESTTNPFDLLPDEMVIRALSFVSVDSLLNCRLVCRRWQVLIDSCVFQEKAAQENEIVNNGRGFYSFSQIDSNNVRKLKLPWYVFYVICKYDPFNKNLVKNNCGQDGLKHWTTNERDYFNELNWIIENPPSGTSVLPNDPDFDGYSSCFVSTYVKCLKSQKIILKNYGLTKTVMKFLQPDILVSDWYSGRYDCGCKYTFQATLHGKNDKELDTYDYEDILLQWDADRWIKVCLYYLHANHMHPHRIPLAVLKISHSFKNQGNATSLTLFHSGVDTQFWAGHYGTKISGSVVKVMLPIILKSPEY